MSDDPLKPGGALEGRLFQGFLRRLSEIREPKAGDRIGAWRIVHELGRGGSGVVYRAERADGAFSQQVALKWLRGDRPNPGGREALARERELLASLDHPHIVRLIDGGQTDDGMLWFAMDLAEGRTIDRHAASLLPRERLKLVAKLCRAVHHAHRRGLIHGDIKPSNVLVDGRGEPRLADFGISRLKGGGPGSSYGLTPDYASPEQRAGDELTTASDIWQLGHLLEDLLADQVPASDLRSIMARATAEIPEDRYASAAAMASDIEAWLAHRPVLAHQGSFAYRLLRLVQRNTALSVISATALVIIIAGGVWMTWQLADERDLARAEAERADLARAQAEAELLRSEALRDFLVGLFRAVRPDRPQDELPSTEELLDVGARRAMDPAAAPDAERVGMLLTIADVFGQLGRPDEAMPLVEEALVLSRRAERERPADLARAKISKGILLLYPGPEHAEQSAELFRRAEELVEGQAQARNVWLQARNRRAWLKYRLGDAPGALALLDPVARRIEGDDETVWSESERLDMVNHLAGIHGRLGNHERALAHDLEAIDLSARVHGAESLSHAIQRANAAVKQTRMGAFERAADNLEIALDLYDRIFPDRAVPYRAAALSSLATLALYTGDYERALKRIGQSMDEWAAGQGLATEDYQWTDYHFGRMLLRMQRDSEAMHHLERAIDDFAAPDSPTSGAAMSRVRLALVNCRQGDDTIGRGLLDSISAWPEPDGIAHQSELAEAEAACLHARQNHQQALVSIDRSLDMTELPGAALKRAQRLALRASILQALERPEEAEASLQQARYALFDVGLDDHPQLQSLSRQHQDPF